MKNKVLLIFTIMISSIVCINDVSAATELTCVYEKGWVQPAIKFVQLSDGTHKIYTTKSKKQPEINDSSWKEDSEAKIASETELNKCPGFADYSSKKVVSLSFSNPGLDFKKLIHEDIVKDTTPDDQIINNEVTNGNWLMGCKYKLFEQSTENENKDDKVIGLYLYFNNNENNNIKLIEEHTLTGNVEVQSTSEKEDSNYKWHIIDNDVLVNRYNMNKGCPTFIYRETFTEGETTKTIYSLNRTSRTHVATAYVYENGTDTEQNKNNDDLNPENCEQLFGQDVVNFINEIMKWIRICVPILLIVLGILDFSKAVFSKTEDDMKKTREKFIKRIVAAVLVFLAPIFVNMILSVANSVWSDISPDTCIK